MLAAEHDDSELVCDSLRYVEPVQLRVQQPRQAPIELVGTGKDAGSSVEHSLKPTDSMAEIRMFYTFEFRRQSLRVFQVSEVSIPASGVPF